MSNLLAGIEELPGLELAPKPGNIEISVNKGCERFGYIRSEAEEYNEEVSNLLAGIEVLTGLGI